MQKLFAMVVTATLLSVGVASSGSAADTYGSCGIVASSSADYPQVGTGYVVTDENGVESCYPIQDPAYYVCIDGTTRSNKISGYGAGAIQEYSTVTKTSIYASVQRVREIGRATYGNMSYDRGQMIPQEERLYKKVLTLDGGGVMNFKRNIGYKISEVGFDFNSVIGGDNTERFWTDRTNKAVKGIDTVAFTEGISGVYYHRVAGAWYSITFYLHEHIVRQVTHITEEPPEPMPVTVTYNGSGECPPLVPLPIPEVKPSTSKIVPTRCSYDNCDDDFTGIEHTMPADDGGQALSVVATEFSVDAEC